jgi:glucokinase
MVVVGVDLGGSKVAATTLGGPAGSPSPAQVWKEHQLAGMPVVDLVVDALYDCAQGVPPTIVGLSVAGWLDAGRERVREAANLGLSDIPLPAVVAERIGAPVVMINDGDATALAEVLLGAGRGSSTVVCVALGTGVGGGIVLQGELLTGAHGLGGEIGHLPVGDMTESCVCGGRGCLELYASGPAIARLAGAADARAALRDFHAGAPRAVEAVAGAAEAGARAIALLMPVLDPDLVVLGGSLAGPLGEPFLDQIRGALADMQPLRDFSIPPTLRIAELGAMAAAMGAATYAAQIASKSSRSNSNGGDDQ